MSNPTTFLDGRVTLYAGDCLAVLPTLEECSVDSVVCDPPYHLTSIVKRFGGDMPPRTEATVGKHAYGRHARGFMGRTWDGGDVAFQIETWQQVLRVLKPGGYLLAFASTRGFGRMSVAIEDAGFVVHPLIAWVFGSGFPKATRVKTEGYDGFRYGGQALKPAIEPIFMGQKPFGKGLSGTENILKHGTGAVNIDGCRVGAEGGTTRLNGSNAGKPRNTLHGGNFGVGQIDAGRWPANLIHDGSEEVLQAFPEAPGQLVAAKGGSGGSGNIYNGVVRGERTQPRDHGGSAARFFYCAKADSEDRIGSKHPTVKPLDLIQYLVRLVTPPGGTVLDPFAGTGTTGEAAFREGFRAVLIEREPEYLADIARRMDLAANPSKRAAVVKSKGAVKGAEGTPLFPDDHKGCAA